nr:hypothetical protein [Tanacetum cinerariifolium]
MKATVAFSPKRWLSWNAAPLDVEVDVGVWMSHMLNHAKLEDEVNKTARDDLWAHFKHLFQWEVVTDGLVREVWEDTIKNRYPDIMFKVRNVSIKMAQLARVEFDGSDFSVLKPYNPKWIESSFWEDMIDREKELKTSLTLTTSEIFELTHTKKGAGNGLHEFMKLKADKYYFSHNREELHPFIGLFDDFVRHTQPQLDEGGLESYSDKKFVEWLEQHVCESSDDLCSHLKGLARGPLCHAWSHKGYFINGFKFHTEKYEEDQVMHNSRVCVKGSCYNETECDFYGLLEEVIEVAYRGMGRCVVVLFKCKWFDAGQGVRIDNKHNLVDIKYNSRLINDEPFVLASQVEQVYYAPYSSMTKDLKDWWVVVKTKSRSIYE